MKKNIYILSLTLVVFQTLHAQKTATGSWYGRADVEMAGIHNNYLTELIIRQKGNKVDGIFGYYFRDKYTSFFVHGRYNPKTREIRILNIPVIYFNSNSTVNSIDCITNFQGLLMVSKVKSSLSGYFYRDEKYKYTCPDLSVHYTLDKGDQKQDSVLSKATAGSRIWKPLPDDYVVNASENKKEDTALSGPKNADSLMAIVRTDSASRASGVAGKTTTTAATIVKTPTTGSGRDPVTGMATGSSPAVADTLANGYRKNDAPVVTTTTIASKDISSPPPPPVDSQAITLAKAKADAKVAAEKTAELAKADAKKISESFAKRKTIPAGNKALEVETDSVRVSFYDNGIIDGDSISVFLNHQLILSHQELAAKALTIYVHLDSLKEVNEISMFAENLGKYPPNTALMVVTDGINRYEVFMSSSLTQNAAILLRRKER